MADDPIDLTGFVLTIISFATSLSVVWHFAVAPRLPPGRLKAIDDSLKEAETYMKQLRNSGRTVENAAGVDKLLTEFRESRLDGLSVDVTHTWRELGWRRFLHPRPSGLIRDCNELFDDVDGMLEKLRVQRLFQVSSVGHDLRSAPGSAGTPVRPRTPLPTSESRDGPPFISNEWQQPSTPTYQRVLHEPYMPAPSMQCMQFLEL
ncbi:uncharacterized protein TRAVEDRAFT_41131 [Trametes versicolor FP-101664 SS1]|uniref:uncharacterized protein n=1 Tax=Trametes versicolor (strain FP-101664) TaxID=717944 RepID=UPI00046247F7|nr:uncharacterized protein TRAVEDRAFT_41131 [Trametes versicolor FP-101664 SS1]EIW63700.1 hypothetical protein TRAVEDRAFT_41131 [Trametes versicolor FP-101664 SS1]